MSNNWVSKAGYTLNVGVVIGLATYVGASGAGKDCILGSPAVLALVVGSACSAFFLAMLTVCEWNDKKKS